MNFEDLIGLVIFLAIVIISSILRSIKEAKESKDKGEKPTHSPISSPKVEEESEKTFVPKRKIVIRTEESEIHSPVSDYHQKTSIDESLKEVYPSVIEESKESEVTVTEKYSEAVQEKEIEEGIPQEKKKVFPSDRIREKLVKIQKKEFPKYPSLVKPLYKKEITFTAPMEKRTLSPTPQIYIGKSMLGGSVGGVPQLHWAIVMMELLSPPKSLRDEF